MNVKENKPQALWSCLILFSLLAVGCWRNSAPQKSEPVVIEKHTRDTIYLTNADLAIGDDCSSYALALDKNATLLAKYENEINGMLADNETLKADLDKCQSRPRKEKNIIKDSYNTDNSENYNLKNSNQILAKDNARLRADSAVMADKLKQKDIGSTKKSGNTTHKGDKFWLGVLVTTGVFQVLRLAKKYSVLAPPPFGQILYTILKLIV